MNKLLLGLWWVMGYEVVVHGLRRRARVFGRVGCGVSSMRKVVGLVVHWRITEYKVKEKIYGIDFALC